MAQTTCPKCGKVLVGDLYDLPRLLDRHEEMEHRQGFRGSSSWNKCSACGGTGRDAYRLPCKICRGSGMV
ncbi:hypothetical protein IJ118_02585 [Candidatus Saccharibacteria bacterium]|nr:hypothetical protein [Candidatus Saccharibacteria bacterium]